MRFFILSVFLFAVLVAVTRATKCELKHCKKLSIGSHKNPDNACGILECTKDGGVACKFCGEVPKGCKLVEQDRKQDFPDCCPKYSCK